MPKLLQDPLGRILFHIDQAQKEKRRFIVSLAGYPGSGKSTLVKKWAKAIDAQMGKGQFLAVGMDGFHLTKAQLAALPDPETAMARRGMPYTFDLQSFATKVEELQNAVHTCAVGWPEFEHSIGDPISDAITIPADCHVILIEGLYTLLKTEAWGRRPPLFDETWFLDISIETSMQRLCTRHQRVWGMTLEQAYQRVESNDRLNCEYIAPSREMADFIVTERENI